MLYTIKNKDIIGGFIMKKFICLVMTCIMTFGLIACSSSSNSDKLIVGTEAGFAPYEYLQGTEIVGIDMDIARAIADAMGKELEIKNMDFDGALVAVQQGKVDFVVAGVSVTEKRKKNMDFSDFYVDSTEVVVVNEENPEVVRASNLDGKIVGVQQGNVADIWVSNTDNVEVKEIKRYTSFAQAAKDLTNRKIDCIVMDEIPAQELVKSTAGLKVLEGEENILFKDQYAIAVKKGNQELLDQINKIIADLKESGKMDEIFEKYMKE